MSSRLESNPRGADASLTYNFNRWFGLTLDTSTHWGSGETGLPNRIDDAAFSNLSLDQSNVPRPSFLPLSRGIGGRPSSYDEFSTMSTK